MKIRSFAPLTATLDLSPTDCLLLADALAEARYHDGSPDPDYADALRAALEACAVIAATDTLRDNQTPEAGMLEDTRRVWATHSQTGTPQPRMVTRPA